MTWDPVNMIIYSVVLRWLPEGADRYERDAEYDQTEEHWLTYSMAKKTISAMVAKHVPKNSEWWSVEILLTRPNIHNADARLYSNTIEEEEWESE